MSEMIATHQIIELIQERLNYRRICEDWIQVQILRSVALARGVTVAEDAIQAEGDRQRHERRLERSSDTLAWLASEQVTPEQWEQGIKDQLLRSAMAEHLFAGDVERIFAENQLNYDRRAVYRLEILERTFAQELFYQIEGREISFFEAVYTYGQTEEIRDRCGFEGLRHRWEFSNSQAQVIFEAGEHQVLVPIETETGFVLFWVGRVVPAVMTSEIRTTILAELLDQWLAEEMVRWMHYDAPEMLTERATNSVVPID
jgi:hypothetical protein